MKNYAFVINVTDMIKIHCDIFPGSECDGGGGGVVMVGVFCYTRPLHSLTKAYLP